MSLLSDDDDVSKLFYFDVKHATGHPLNNAQAFALWALPNRVETACRPKQTRAFVDAPLRSVWILMKV